MLTYQSLREKLQGLETCFVDGGDRAFPGASAIRTNLSPLQGFALDTTTSSSDEALPVVVAVGSNYTQADQTVPRDQLGGQLSVEDNLKQCRRLLDEAFSAYRRLAEPWFACGKASSADLPCPRSYHLVMTNFCLWNTTQKWTDLRVSDRATLLRSNPQFQGKPTTGPAWPHLQSLAAAVNASQPLWVAHGLHSEVFALFTAWRSYLGGSDWLMTPNLSYRYFHYGKRFPR